MDDNNFSSLDRLIEFGLGMGMAQQMINMMNQTMQTMQVPELSKPLQIKEVEWYLAIDNKPAGPFKESEMKSLLLNKKMTKDTLVWSYGMQNWQKIENTPEILKLLIQLPPTL